MQQLNISLNKGVHRSPSYAQNGELAECVNLYVKDGELRNIPKVCTLKDGAGANDFVLAAGHSLLALHNTDGKRIYISRKATGGSTVSYELYANVWEEGVSQASPIKINGFSTGDNVRVLSLGRMMMVLDTSGLHYFIWKGSGYKYLGDKVPTLPISFGLQCEMKKLNTKSGAFNTLNITVVPTDNDNEPLGEAGTEGHLQYLTDTLYAAAAEFTEKATKNGKFAHSFFVRYALRLYDGTNICASSPVLMLVSTNEAFIVAAQFGTAHTLVTGGMIEANLDYHIRAGVLAAYDDWKDLIKGVDIYVSAPIYTYNPSSNSLYGIRKHNSETFAEHSADSHNLMDRYVKCPALISHDSEADYSIMSGYGFSVGKQNITGAASYFHNDEDWPEFFSLTNKYMKWDMALLFMLRYEKGPLEWSNPESWDYVLRLERKSQPALLDEYKGDGPYFLLKSYKFDELVEDTENTGARQIVETPGLKKGITTQRQLVDTALSTTIKSVSDAIVYNNRLNLSNVKEEVKCEWPLESLLPFTDGHLEWGVYNDTDYSYPLLDSVNSDLGTQEQWHLSVRIKNGTGGHFIVSDAVLAPDGVALNMRSSLLGFHYPDANADMAVLHYTFNAGSALIPIYQSFGVPLTLSESELSDMVYYIGDLQNKIVPLTVPGDTSNNLRSYPNVLFQSNIENPLVFQAKNEKNVGSGSILRLAVLSERLSAAQFGQYPMVAFCTDGMYALEVNKEDGTLYDPKPLQPDVLTNIDSVISVDGGVIYITNQGLKFLGRDKDIRLLSGPMEGANINESSYKTLLGNNITDADWKPLFVADTDDIRQALQTCRMVYDLKNRLVRIFFEGIDKQTVLSLDTGEFSSQIDRGMPLAVIEDYGMSVMQFSGDQKLYVYDAVPTSDLRYGMAISRILNFSEVEQYVLLRNMKIYHSVLSEGGKVGTAVFVSPDKKNWSVLTSLKGASYKYFRFALFTKMDDYEAVSGLAMLYDIRRNNKLR